VACEDLEPDTCWWCLDPIDLTKLNDYALLQPGVVCKDCIELAVLVRGIA
jgi:hypothetical protein